MMERSDRLRGISRGRLAVIGMVLALGTLVAMVSIPVSAVVVNFLDPGLDAVKEPKKERVLQSAA